MITQGQQLAEFVALRVHQDEVRATSDVRVHNDLLSKATHALVDCESRRNIAREVDPWLVDEFDELLYPSSLRIILALALNYADDPEFRDEWRLLGRTTTTPAASDDDTATDIRRYR